MRRFLAIGLLAGCFLGSVLALGSGCVGYEELNAEPNDDYENFPPIIDSFRPGDPTVRIRLSEEGAQEFSIISVSDPNDDQFFGYRWVLDDQEGDASGVEVSNGSFFRFQPSTVGAWTLKVTVWDCPGVGKDNDFTGLKPCQEAQPEDSLTTQVGWTILVEP